MHGVPQHNANMTDDRCTFFAGHDWLSQVNTPKSMKCHVVMTKKIAEKTSVRAGCGKTTEKLGCTWQAQSNRIQNKLQRKQQARNEGVPPNS